MSNPDTIARRPNGEFDFSAAHPEPTGTLVASGPHTGRAAPLAMASLEAGIAELRERREQIARPAEPELTDVQTEVLRKLNGLVAGVTGSTGAQVEKVIAQMRQDYLDLPEQDRPVTPESFVAGFRGRKYDTRAAPQDPATVWAHFRALHDPDAFPTSHQQIASIDLETASAADAGWNDAASGHIIEVGIVIYAADGTEQSRYSQLVRPPAEFMTAHGTGRQDIHGIEPGMLSDEPEWHQVTADVRDQLAGRTMLAQNERFEKQWLGAHLPGFDGSAPSVDPMALSRLINQGMPNHKLSTICERAGIAYVDGHRAAPDAQMAASAFFAMRNSMHERWRTEFGPQDRAPRRRNSMQ